MNRINQIRNNNIFKNIKGLLLTVLMFFVISSTLNFVGAANFNHTLKIIGFNYSMYLGAFMLLLAPLALRNLPILKSFKWVYKKIKTTI